MGLGLGLGLGFGLGLGLGLGLELGLGLGLGLRLRLEVAGVTATPAKLHARSGVGARLAPRTVSSRRSAMPDARGETDASSAAALAS